MQKSKMPTYDELAEKVRQLEQASDELRENEKRTIRQQAAITELALNKISTVTELNHSLEKICELMAKIIDVARTSIWLLSPDGSELRCITLYEAHNHSHSSGAVLYAKDFPEYFDTIKAESRLSAEDAQNDPRTRKLADEYLKPLGITSLLDSGIIRDGKLFGVVSAEHIGPKRKWRIDEESFANTMASFVSQRIADSERARAENELKKTQQTLDSIISKIPDIIYRLDTEGRITFINDSVRVYGYRPAEMIGKNILDYVHPDDKEKAKYRINERRTGQRSTSSFEIRLVTRKNESRYFETKSGVSAETPVFLLDAEGLYASNKNLTVNFIGTQGVARDITDRKQAEEESLKNAMLLKVAGRIAKVGGWSMDLINHTVHLSEELLTIHGLEPGHIPSFDESTKFTVPEWREKVIEAYKTCIRDGTPVDIEFEVHRASGERIWVHTNGEAVRNKTGEVVQVWGALQDITDRKKLEARLLQSQKMEAIGTLAGGIAHDFNNILTAILGYVDLSLFKISADSSPVKDYLGEIEKAGIRAKDLVKQILTFSRQSKVERSPLELGPIIKETLKFLKASLPSTIELNISLESEPITIMADAIQIHQVLMNLCTNAYHAMRINGGTLSVSLVREEVSAQEASALHLAGSGTYACLSVADTGHGMSPKIQQRIFEPFFTTKERGEGTGMGLSVVHGIVKDAGGFISLYSEEEKGATFRIFWPLSGVESSKTITDCAHYKRGDEAIVVVDDEAAIVESTAGILDSLGYRVKTFTDSRDALHFIRHNANEVDLLISDLTMPQLTGLELIRKIRETNLNLPVILTTGFSGAIHNETMRKLGVDRLLIKPTLGKTLSETIRSVLDQS